MPHTITLNEVMMNLMAYALGKARLGELPDNDGIHTTDWDYTQYVGEHITTNEVGTVEDEAIYDVPTHRHTVVDQWPMGTVHNMDVKKTRTILAVRDAYLDGVHYDKVYIKEHNM